MEHPSARPVPRAAGSTAARGTAWALPISRRGPHWRARPLAAAQLAVLVLVGAACLALASATPLLALPVLCVVAATAVLRRRDWLEHDVLLVRRVRTRRVPLGAVHEAHVRSVPALDCRVVELVLTDPAGHEVAVPVWRTRSPRGVDAFACDNLADRLTEAPVQVLALLRAQGEAVRTGARPTPLDRLVSPYPRTRRRDWPSTSTPPPKAAVSRIVRAGPASPGAGPATEGSGRSGPLDRLPSRAEVRGSNTPAAPAAPPGVSSRTGPARSSRTGSR